MKKQGKIILGVAAILIVGLLTGVYFLTKPSTTVGEKNITITVVDKEEKETVYKVKTNALYLKGVMDQADGLTYDGENQGSGFMITTINGIRADYTLDSAYWGFFVNDDYCNYGIEEQPVSDGDNFRIVYTDADTQ